MDLSNKEVVGSPVAAAVAVAAFSSVNNQSRPTKEEAMELSIIMSTPPSSGDFLTPIQRQHHRTSRNHEARARGHSAPNRRTGIKQLSISPLVTPETAQTTSSFNNEPACLPHFPKIKTGPPYESSLPLKTTFSLQPRASSSLLTQRKRPAVQTTSLLAKQLYRDGIGPFLSILPESIIYSIVNYIDYRERHPKLLLISHTMTNILTRPEFLLQTRQATLSSTNFNELLFVVGGKYPTKASDNNDTYNGENDGERLPRRMPFKRNDLGIMGYDTKRQVWMRFGGDPMQHPAPVAAQADVQNVNNALHPLSPHGIIEAKPLYVGHPHYCLFFFGGTHQETGMPSSRVIAYSFLTARWGTYPDMMRPRRGDDFVVARVEGSAGTTCKDSIILIGCDLEFCDCLRCNPPPSSDRPAVSIDVISFADNECEEMSSKLRMRRDCLHSMRRSEILDLESRTWKRSNSRAPFCPPDDGGVAVIQGRYVYLPGTCPPPPMSTLWNQTVDDACGAAAEIITPMSQSETNSCTELSQSPPSSIGEMHIPAATIDYDQLSTSSMDIERESDDAQLSPLGTLYRSLHYRPGMVYDAWTDSWCTLPARQFVTTSSPTTCTFRDHVLVLGGYRSSSENALSCYRHREEEAILDYEDHLDYAWFLKPNNSKCFQDLGDSETSEYSGEWQFGGGTTMFGHRQAWAHSSDLASAVAAAAAIHNDTNQATDQDMSNQMPNRAPCAVRGASATTFQGRLTVLGGLSTFSRTFYDIERKVIWQYYPETREWRRASMQIPLPALCDGYAFSVHV
ncbi:hypothetical protein ACHAWC_010356 [Mediolabrus comicus]